MHVDASVVRTNNRLVHTATGPWKYCLRLSKWFVESVAANFMDAGHKRRQRGWDLGECRAPLATAKSEGNFMYSAGHFHSLLKIICIGNEFRRL